MKKSSKLALTAAILCLIVGALSWIVLGDQASGPFNQATAERFVKSGLRAFEERDPKTLMDLFAANAVVFQRSPDQIRSIVKQATDEMGKTKLQLTMANMVVEPGESGGRADFDLQISEKNEKISVIYYKIHVRMSVVKQKVSNPFGLGSKEVWKIVSADGDADLQLPVIDHD